VKCTQVLRRIEAYFDGELPPDERAGMEEHLRSCPSCSRELQLLRSLSSLVRGVEVPSVSAPLWESYPSRVLRRAQKEGERKRPAARRERGFPLFHPRLAYAAAAIFLVFLAGMVYHFTMPPTGPDVELAAPRASQRTVVERFEAGDLASSVMTFAPEKDPVAVVWVFGCRVEGGQNNGGGAIL
jgi:anti-sigma factor RsiW